MSSATVTPSLVTLGEPHPLSRTALRPRGPRVLFTARASFETPASNGWRASSSNTICLATGHFSSGTIAGTGSVYGWGPLGPRIGSSASGHPLGRQPACRPWSRIEKSRLAAVGQGDLQRCRCRFLRRALVAAAVLAARSTNAAGHRGSSRSPARARRRRRRGDRRHGRGRRATPSPRPNACSDWEC